MFFKCCIYNINVILPVRCNKHILDDKIKAKLINETNSCCPDISLPRTWFSAINQPNLKYIYVSVQKHTKHTESMLIGYFNLVYFYKK